MRHWIAVLGLAATAAVIAAVGWHQRAAAQSEPFDARETGAIERIIRDYLIANPEVLDEALQALEAKREQDRLARISAAIEANRDELLHHEDDVVLGNPEGDVTLVEFFDYNCGYCERALSDLQTLLDTDPQLRVILKELPILSPGSLEAAKVSIAVARQGQYWEFHSELLGGRGQADARRALAIAESLDLDMDRLRADMDGPETARILEETHALALELGVEGTPAYVIGEELVPGAIGVEGLRRSVAEARASACATC